MSLLPANNAASAIEIFKTIDESAVETILNLNSDTKNELAKIDTLDFDIF